MVLFHLWYFPPYFFCKVNANERNGKEILSFYLLRYMISIIFISIFRPCSKSFLRLRFHSHQEPAATFAHLSYIKNEAASRLYTPSLPHSLYIKSEIKIILYIYLPRIKNHSLYISSKDKNHPLYLHPKSKKLPSFHLLLRHKSFPSLVIIEDANLGNFPFRFVSYFDSRLRIIIWCTINTLSSLKQSAFILWGRRGT